MLYLLAWAQVPDASDGEALELVSATLLTLTFSLVWASTLPHCSHEVHSPPDCTLVERVRYVLMSV